MDLPSDPVVRFTGKIEPFLTPKPPRPERRRFSRLKLSPPISSTDPGPSGPLDKRTESPDEPRIDLTGSPNSDLGASESNQVSFGQLDMGLRTEHTLAIDSGPPVTTEGASNCPQIIPGNFLERLSKTDPLDIAHNTQILLVGDSNLRYFKPAPPNWQVICIPGLRLNQLTALLKTLGKLPNLKHIIISAGINDRDSADILPLKDCLKAGRLTRKTLHFQSIIASSRLPLHQLSNINMLNSACS